jgi:hypothetical protein
MTKSDKIREHFRKYPTAEVAKVAAKFKAPKPMTYKLRKQVQEEDQLITAPAPDAPTRKVTITASQMAIAKKLGVKPDDFVREGLKLGVLQYDDERDFTGEAEETDIDETLDNRAKDYGKFIQGAEIMQMLKRMVHNYIELRGTKLAFDQREAIDMIIHKLGRIINGNPDKVDTWVDIAGYAKLVADRLEGIER